MSPKQQKSEVKDAAQGEQDDGVQITGSGVQLDDSRVELDREQQGQEEKGDGMVCPVEHDDTNSKQTPGGEGNVAILSPERKMAKPDDGGKPVTPFDNVLNMLKEGKMAGRTPLKFPSPASVHRTGDGTAKRLHTSFASPSPTKILAAGNGISEGAHRHLGTFTFEATRTAYRKRQEHETPSSMLGKGVKPFASTIPASLAPGSRLKVEGTPAPLAWTPMRSSPTGLGRSFAAMPGSRKRRAEDDAQTPMEDGSVSLLDMQRRRRFKPSDDPGSTGRRSWRAGRTPFQSSTMSRIRPGSMLGRRTTPSVAVDVPSFDSPKSTTETARKILATLDSWEETIKKSKEEAKAPTSLQTTEPSPPPTSSLGTFMPKEDVLAKKEEMRPTSSSATPKVTFGITPTVIESSAKRSKRRMDEDESTERFKKSGSEFMETQTVEAKPETAKSEATATLAGTTPFSAPKPGSAAVFSGVKVTPVQPSPAATTPHVPFSLVPDAEKQSVSPSYSFGQSPKDPTLKKKIAEAVSGTKVVPKPEEPYLFGKEKTPTPTKQGSKQVRLDANVSSGSTSYDQESSFFSVV